MEEFAETFSAKVAYTRVWVLPSGRLDSHFLALFPRHYLVGHRCINVD